MQDRYVADVGDFGKYGLLRSLCGGDELGKAQDAVRYVRREAMYAALLCCAGLL